MSTVLIVNIKYLMCTNLVRRHCSLADYNMQLLSHVRQLVQADRSTSGAKRVMH